MTRVRFALAAAAWWLSERLMDVGYLLAEGRTYAASLAESRDRDRR